MMTSSAQKKNVIEDRAAALVGIILPEVTVERQDLGQGVQIRDFDIVHATGEREPLEVTCATLEHVEQAHAAHSKYLSAWVIRAVRGLAFNWHLMPSDRVRFSALTRHSILGPLSELEEAGMKRWSATRDGHRFPALGGMGFQGASRWSAVASNQLPEVVVGPPNDDAIWASSTSDPGANVIAAVEQAAGRADNRKKLRCGSPANRHLFVWVADTNYLPWRDLFVNTLPLRRPMLPDEVTAVWVATSVPESELAVWRWVEADGWTAITIRQCSDSADGH